MGLYDLDKKWDGRTKPSLGSLYKDILETYHSDSFDPEHEIQRIKERIRKGRVDDNHPRKGSGIINRLISHVGYDIEENGKISNNDFFYMCQLLKFLYKIEIVDRDNTSNPPPSFISLLSKPSLENTNSGFTETTRYGDYFDSISTIIKNHTLYSDNIYATICNVNHAFTKLKVQLQLNYLVAPLDISKNTLLSHLRRIKCILTQNILNNLTIYENTPPVYWDTVFETFYSIICKHYFLCYDKDLQRIDNSILEKTLPSNYCDIFKRYEDSKDNTIDTITNLKNFIKQKNDNPFLIQSYDVIKAGLDDEETINFDHNLLYALDRVIPIIKLIEFHRDHTNFTEIINIPIFWTALQEIIHIHVCSPSIKKNDLNSTIKGKALSSALTSKNAPQDIDSEVGLAWVERIANRLSVNFGLGEIHLEVREVIKTLLTIKERIYNRKEFLAFCAINSNVIHFVQLIIQNPCADFSNEVEDLQHILKIFSKNITVKSPPS